MYQYIPTYKRRCYSKRDIESANLAKSFILYKYGYLKHVHVFKYFNGTKNILDTYFYFSIPHNLTWHSLMFVYLVFYSALNVTAFYFLQLNE